MEQQWDGQVKYSRVEWSKLNRNNINYPIIMNVCWKLSRDKDKNSINISWFDCIFFQNYILKIPGKLSSVLLALLKMSLPLIETYINNVIDMIALFIFFKEIKISFKFQNMNVCTINPELKKRLREFRFRKETKNAAIISMLMLFYN